MVVKFEQETVIITSAEIKAASDEKASLLTFALLKLKEKTSKYNELMRQKKDIESQLAEIKKDITEIMGNSKEVIADDFRIKLTTKKRTTLPNAKAIELLGNDVFNANANVTEYKELRIQ